MGSLPVGSGVAGVGATPEGRGQVVVFHFRSPAVPTRCGILLLASLPILRLEACSRGPPANQAPTLSPRHAPAAAPSWSSAQP